MRAWVGKLLQWWVGSRNGRAARALKNNIADGYENQALAMALYAGHNSTAADLVTKDVRGRVDTQINGSGALPLEDVRSDSFSYHMGTIVEILNMAAFTQRAARLTQITPTLPFRIIYIKLIKCLKWATLQGEGFFR